MKIYEHHFYKSDRKDLESNISVDYWTTGLNEAIPDLFPYLRQVLLHGPYDVIHFNVGLHGWANGRVEDSQYR